MRRNRAGKAAELDRVAEALLGVLALWWVARNLPIAPFDTLPV